MESRLSISETEILDALREAFSTEDDPDGAHTTEELAAATGISRARIKVALRDLIRAGKAETVRVRRTSIDGRTMPVPGYRVKAA